MRTLCLAALLITLAATSCKSTRTRSNSDLHEVVPVSQQMTIEGPFKQLIYDRTQTFDLESRKMDSPWVPVKIGYNKEEFEAKVRLRGGISFCNAFPQLKLKLPKDKKIAGQREFKVKTHGSYKVDPSIPVKAPSCGDEIFDQPDYSERARRDMELYELSSKVLDYHLNYMKLDVRYIDKSILLDQTERAYFIEDADAAAERYGMKAKKFEGMDFAFAWRGESEEEMIEYIKNELAIVEGGAWLESEKVSNPKLSEAELNTRLMGKIGQILEDNSGSLAKKIEKDKVSILESAKSKQLETLRNFDKKNLAQTILFQILLHNTDSNLLGINDHIDPFKNVEIFQNKEGKLFVAPYDFDGAMLVGAKPDLGEEFYTEELNEFKTTMEKNFPGIVLPAIKQFGPDLILKLEKTVSNGESSPRLHSSIRAFNASLQEFLLKI